MEEKSKIRLDKWLWYARFFKTRSLSAGQVSGGHVRVNGTKVLKPASGVGEGDVLTFVQGERVRVVKIIAPGTRRGPAPEAQALYEDLTPPPAEKPPEAPRFEGRGRPSKKERREIVALRDRELE